MPSTPRPSGHVIGYARTSTADQMAGLEAQRRELEAAGCSKVFSEQVSGRSTARPQLAAALDYVREGDTFVVAKPDRLARSTADLLRIAEELKAKGVRLRILSMDVDTGTPTGRLMLTMLAGIAEFERELMLERQREGIADAKAAGRYKGRKPTARAKAEEVARLHAEGVAPKAIGERLEISRASVFRILKDHRASEQTA